MFLRKGTQELAIPIKLINLTIKLSFFLMNFTERNARIDPKNYRLIVLLILLSLSKAIEKVTHDQVEILSRKSIIILPV